MLLVALFLPSAFCWGKKKSTVTPEEEAEIKYTVLSVSPSVVMVGQESTIKLKVAPAKSEFCAVRIGDALIKAFVDKSGVVSVRAPPLKAGTYLVSISYDNEKWASEKEIVYQYKQKDGDPWVILFPLVVAVCLCVSIFICNAYGFCTGTKKKEIKWKEVTFGEEHPYTIRKDGVVHRRP